MAFGSVTLNDGNKMPTIAFGSGSKWKGHDVTDYVVQAIETGFSHIDTAQAYQNQDSVGQAIRESALDRSDLFITTKWSFKQKSVHESVQESLTFLGLKQLDLYLIHFPGVLTNLEQDWREIEKVKEDGLTKSIGVSNWTLPLMQELLKFAKIKPAVNQIRFHPYNYAENKDLLEYTAKHGIVTEGYGSLSSITSFPGGPVDEPVQAAADRLGVTPTQVILSWVKSKGVVIVTTSSSAEHLKEYLAVGGLPPLTAEEIAAIDEAGAKGPPAAWRVRNPLITAARSSLLAAAGAAAIIMWGLYTWHCQ
ncbi:Aldo/keto reductase [Amylocystis lapponica]|nr:Aldo/keto reductase [Amylocystis lapponica]